MIDVGYTLVVASTWLRVSHDYVILIENELLLNTEYFETLDIGMNK